jgi:hypothetical protein
MVARQAFHLTAEMDCAPSAIFVYPSILKSSFSLNDFNSIEIPSSVSRISKQELSDGFLRHQ